MSSEYRGVAVDQPASICKSQLESNNGKTFRRGLVSRQSMMPFWTGCLEWSPIKRQSAEYRVSSDQGTVGQLIYPSRGLFSHLVATTALVLLSFCPIVNFSPFCHLFSRPAGRLSIGLPSDLIKLIFGHLNQFHYTKHHTESSKLKVQL